jgi:hypothetical protein
MAAMQNGCVYHATAIPFPDGRVVKRAAADSADGSGQDQLNAEIYSPPYLFARLA